MDLIVNACVLYFQRVFVGTRGTDTVCEDCKTGYYSTPGLNCTEGKRWVISLAYLVAGYCMNSRYFIYFAIFTITLLLYNIRPINETKITSHKKRIHEKVATLSILTVCSCLPNPSSCGNAKVLQKGSQTKETVCNTAPRRHHYDVILSVMLFLL